MKLVAILMTPPKAMVSTGMLTRAERLKDGVVNSTMQLK
jgi:hypothetical protein